MGERKPALVVFADARFSHTLRRITFQARISGYFGKIFAFTESDLDEGFRTRFSDYLRREVPGFGYWVWKPQVIFQALSRLDDGEALVYLDAGCEIKRGARSTFDELVRRAERDGVGVLCSEVSYREGYWTKPEVFEFFGLEPGDPAWLSNQRQAGILVLINRVSTRSFIRSWRDICCSNPELLDNATSNQKRPQHFQAHRNDQSIFSILSKMAGTATVPAELFENKHCSVPKGLGVGSPFVASRKLSQGGGLKARALDYIFYRPVFNLELKRKARDSKYAN